ncbi:MAG: tRNA/rRNA methyltransferase [Chloroflexi bacterium]|nr:tRNA/rRNA methyltransferase [Chloroflexota bacterium]
MSSVPLSNPLERIVFVLHQPQDVNNVGAVVRLLGNFGLTRLRLVEPAAFDADRILRVARRGEAVLAGIERFPSLDAALSDCAFIVGTTRRARALDRPVLSPRQAAPILLTVTDADNSAEGTSTASGLAAVLFGPEDFGLSNAALDHCHAILSIPTVPHDASLNLAQAALLVAYELHLAVSVPPEQHTAPGMAALSLNTGDKLLATGAELDALFDAARRMLQILHDPPIEGRTNAALARLRAMVLRSIPRDDEVALLTSIFEHVAHALPRPRGE